MQGFCQLEKQAVNIEQIVAECHSRKIKRPDQSRNLKYWRDSELLD
jgi:hypothetical protein